jgi:adenylate cyclase
MEEYSGVSSLSARELEIARAYAGGASYKVIAERLFIAPTTVRTHLSTIYRKCGVSSKIDLLHALEAAGAEDPGPPLPDKPSVAVLPFENLSGDKGEEYFADGIAEDIITALSKIHWFFVIARASSFAYRGRTWDVKQISRELGVRYLLQGSVRKSEQRVRVSAQLVDATTGRHVWADRYERELADLFDLQDEMTQTIVLAIEPELSIAERERARRKPPETLDVWDCYQRGLWHIYLYTREDYEEAKRLFQRAIELDSGFSLPYGAMALGDINAFINGFAVATPEALEQMMQAAHRSMALDARDPWAHLALGFSFMMMGDADNAIDEFDQSLELNPNFALCCFGLGYTMTLCGREADALSHLDMAERLNPHAPYLWCVYTVKAEANLMLKNHEEALQWARRAVHFPTASYWSYVALAATLGHLDRIGEATSALQAARARLPSLSSTNLDEPRHRANRTGYQYYLDGLRRAGLKD